jgi:hypothetical protein
MSSNQHPGDKSTQYETWDRRRILMRLKVHACQRLDMLRSSEEQRHMALPATAEQERLLLQIVRELKDDDPTSGQADGCATAYSAQPHAVIDEKTAVAQEAFAKLNPTDRAVVRDASKTLFSLNNVLAEGLIEYKQSDLGKKDQSQEQAPADKGAETDS